MPEPALVVQSHLSYNVPAPLEAATTSLTNLATLYLAVEVAGHSQATLDAKRSDLHRFLAFYHQLYGHDRPDEWFVSVTKAFLKHLRGQRLAQPSLVRIYATVRHFARWIHKHVAGFPLGCPTDGVKAPEEEEPKWKGLSRTDQLRLLHAAQTLRVRKGRGTDQGLRDHALIASLLGTGLLRMNEPVGMGAPEEWIIHRQVGAQPRYYAPSWDHVPPIFVQSFRL